jgi:hypothetical protein
MVLVPPPRSAISRCGMASAFGSSLQLATMPPTSVSIRA